MATGRTPGRNLFAYLEGTTKYHVSNLPKKTVPSDLWGRINAHIKGLGMVADVKIPRKQGKYNMYGFVNIKDVQSPEKLKKKLNKMEIDSHRLEFNLAEEKPNRAEQNGGGSRGNDGMMMLQSEENNKGSLREGMSFVAALTEENQHKNGKEEKKLKRNKSPTKEENNKNEDSPRKKIPRCIGNEREADPIPNLEVDKEKFQRFQKCAVGEVWSKDVLQTLQQKIELTDFDFQVKYDSDSNQVFLMSDNGDETRIFVEKWSQIWKKWFKTLKMWSASDNAVKRRPALIRIIGLPVEARCDSNLETIGNFVGDFKEIVHYKDEIDGVEVMDIPRVRIYTSYEELISYQYPFKVDGKNVSIQVKEEDV